MDATPAATASGETKLPTHTPSSMFLWVLGLTAFTLNLGYGIVLPISEKLAARCGAPEAAGAEGTMAAFTVMALSLISFNLAKVMGEVPGGIFSDRVGDRFVVASSLFIYAISVVILIWARQPWLFTTARFIEGFATGVSYPSMTSVLIRHSPFEKLGRNMSIGMGAGVAGFILGPCIAGPLMNLDRWVHLKERIDIPLWLCFFLSVAVFAMVTAWFWTAAVRSKKGDLSDLASERRAVVADSLIVTGPGPTVAAPGARETFLEGCIREFKVIGRFARSPLFLGFVSPLFFVKLIMCSWQILLFPHAKYLGMGGDDVVGAVGRLMAILAGCLAVLTPISGMVADRISSRLLTHGALVGTVASLALMLLVPGQWAFTALWVAYSCCSAVLINVHLKFVGDTYHEEQQHGRIFGIVHALSDLGMILGPPLIWLYTAAAWGRIATFLLMAGVGGLSVPAFMLSKGREKQLPRP